MAFASRNPSQLHRIRDARRLADALDNEAPQRDTVNQEWFPDAANPNTHASTHQDGGTDKVNVAGLSGVLADAQTPQGHAASHRPDGGTDPLIVAVADEASLPAAGTQGRLRLARNGDGFFYDDGTQWVNLGKVSAMELIATAGPTNLADTDTLMLQIPDVSAYHDLYIEVRGDYSGSGFNESLNLTQLLDVALLREGSWLTPSSDSGTLVRIDNSSSTGDTGIATFPVNFGNANRGGSSPSITIQAQNPVDNAQLRLFGAPNP